MEWHVNLHPSRAPSVVSHKFVTHRRMSLSLSEAKDLCTRLAPPIRRFAHKFTVRSYAAYFRDTTLATQSTPDAQNR